MGLITRKSVKEYLEWVLSMLPDPDCPEGIGCQGCREDWIALKTSLELRIKSLDE